MGNTFGWKAMTDRGLQRIEFVDRYGEKCSIQDSSLATEDAIWFGIDELEIKIDPSHTGGRGWVKHELPPGAHAFAHMHLTRHQVLGLLPLLHFFADKGVLPRGEAELVAYMEHRPDLRDDLQSVRDLLDEAEDEDDGD